ncbi:MAG: hypothetical protein IPO52_15210 [Gemmatimonadetes bacterium]|nr:hypothetical protein [Gemmatimonadota bacterium]
MAVLRRVELHWSRLGIAPRAGLTALCATVGHVAAVLLLVTLPLRLAAQSVAMHTPGQAFQADMIGGLIVHTTWGWAWAAQVLLGVAAVILFRRAQTTRQWMPSASWASCWPFTPALPGHAIAAERWIPLAVLSDGLHIIGAAGWLGTLAVMLIVSITAALGPMEDHGALAAELVTAYSPWRSDAPRWRDSPAWPRPGFTGQLDLLWTTAYGRVLLLKLAILSVVATSAYNWRRVLPRLGIRSVLSGRSLCQRRSDGRHARALRQRHSGSPADSSRHARPLSELITRREIGSPGIRARSTWSLTPGVPSHW